MEENSNNILSELCNIEYSGILDGKNVHVQIGGMDIKSLSMFMYKDIVTITLKTED